MTACDRSGTPRRAQGVADPDAEFDLGELTALDPQKYLGQDVNGVATTGLNSWWNHLRCRNCGHTFRRGDRVEVDFRNRTVRHLDLGAECAVVVREEPSGEAVMPPAAPDGRDVEDFSSGVLAGWPPDAAVHVRRLTDSDWQTRRPAPPMQRTRCLVCAHTFRIGEHAVICPCAPRSPICGSAVHRDPAVGLVCWESWRPDGQVTACPVTLTRRTAGH